MFCPTCADNLHLDDTDTGFEDDEILTTFLNSNGEFRIGGSIYVFKGKTTLLEIIDADTKTLEILRNGIYSGNLHLANVIIHNLKDFEASARLLINDSGIQTPIYTQPPPLSQQPETSIPRSPAGESPTNGGSRSTWNCKVNSLTISLSLTTLRQATLYATLQDMPWAIPPNYTNPGFTNIQWEIYELTLANTTTLIDTVTRQTTAPNDGSPFDVSLTYTFPKEGNYRVCVTAWNNYCKTEKFCRNFYISDLSGCCEWYDFSGKSDIYKSDRALRAELTIRNYPFFSRIKAKSTHHLVRNGNIKFKKKKADRLKISMNGIHRGFACQGNPTSFYKWKDKNSAKRISVCIVHVFPMTVRRLPGNSGCPEVVSVHEAWDGSSHSAIKLLLPLCDRPPECYPGS
ncbi:MAG TPA: hypothetical protein VNJ29_02125 [Candidatus Nitrosotenuis sp.]|nr:hypothetical protein [Candidatus Nitrosotenuis sp.]